MSIRINTTELLKILETTPANQNVMLIGKHGIGKSQILSDFFSSKGNKVVPLFLGQMSDPGDLIGLLHKNDATGRTEFMPPYWFPTDDTPVVLFLDELNRARPEVLQTIMDLALNRTLAGKTLPKGSRIISAVNTGEEYQLTDLDPALVSRFNIYEFCPTASEWLLWAEKNQLDKRVIEFISQNSDYLDGDGNEIEDGSLEKSPDRRAWERVSQIISGLQSENINDTHKKIIAGIVGAKATSKFFESLKTSGMLTAKDLLSKDFELSKKYLSKYATPQFAVLNDDIFRTLETASFSDKTKTIAVQNLHSYFDLLYQMKQREAMAHFVSIFVKPDYPNSLMFIIQHAPELYSKLTGFISEIR